MSDLTAEEQKNVRAAVRFLKSRVGTWKTLAKILRVCPKTVERSVTPQTAFRVAKFAGVGVDDVLTGRFPEPGTCPHCGHRPDAK